MTNATLDDNQINLLWSRLRPALTPYLGRAATHRTIAIMQYEADCLITAMYHRGDLSGAQFESNRLCFQLARNDLRSVWCVLVSADDWIEAGGNPEGERVGDPWARDPRDIVARWHFAANNACRGEANESRTTFLG